LLGVAAVAAGKRGLQAGRQRQEPTMMYMGYNSLWGVLILIADVWAIIQILQSSASNEQKLIWVVAVVLLPLLGLILWYFLGPRGGRT
jgi:phospholipase D-like protein